MRTKQVLIVCIVVFSHISLFAQNQNNDYKKIKEIQDNTNGFNEIKETTENTYKVEDCEIAYTVWNIENKLKNIPPKFLQHMVIPPIEVSNKHVFDGFVRQYFKPYFVNFNSFTYSHLYFYLFADITGNIKEIEIRYPKNIGVIPITDIERFETSLLNSSVKLSFDKNNSVFKGSEWIGTPVMYEAEKVKDL